MQRRLSPERAAATFMLLGACSVVMVVVGLGLWNVFWTDVVRSNPGRSLSHALFVLPLMSAAVGVFLVIFHYSGALILAGVLTALTAHRYGRIPVGALCLLTALCALVNFGQDALLPDFNFYGGIPEEASPSAQALQRNINLNLYFFPGLLGCWLLLRRRASS